MSRSRSISTRRQFLGAAAGSAAAAALGAPAGAAAQAGAPEQERSSSSGRSRAHYRLFSAGRIGTLELENRLVRSAAYEAGGALASGLDKGKVTEGYLTMHRRFAEGGVGLIITGYMSVIDHEFLPGQIGAFDDRFLPGLEKVAETVHGVGNGCKIVAEIGHGGVTWGPSGYAWPTKRPGKVMTIEEIETFCTAMADAALRLQRAGFDGVEIHGAHHYTINAFLSPWSNRRTDRYGGSLEKRVEIVREMVGKMRDRVGPDFPILIKLNCDDGPVDDGTPGEIARDTFPALAREIVETGVDCIDVSGQQLPGDPLRKHLDRLVDESYFEAHARALEVDVPIILGCGNRNVELLERIVTRDDRIEFVSFARPLFAEPDLPNRWREGRGSDSTACRNVNYCYYRIGREGMTHCWLRERAGLDPGSIVA